MERLRGIAFDIIKMVDDQFVANVCGSFRRGNKIMNNNNYMNNGTFE